MPTIIFNNCVYQINKLPTKFNKIKLTSIRTILFE